jgi:ABC-type transport system involved in multi-copper enzyme maturation permease subunit
MRNIWTVARGTIKESVRRKSMLITLVLSLIFILAIGAMAQHLLRPGSDSNDFVQTFQIEGTIRTLSFFGALLTMFITMNAIPLEIERRTVYTLLAKPLERYQFVLGKFLGCLLLLAFNMTVMAVVAFVLIVRHNPTVADGLARSFAILMVSLTSLCGLVILLTTVMPATGGALLAEVSVPP